MFSCAAVTIQNAQEFNFMQGSDTLHTFIGNFISGSDQNAESGSNYSKIYALLDRLIHQKHEECPDKRLAYLDRFTQPILAASALDCFSRFQKFTISVYKFVNLRFFSVDLKIRSKIIASIKDISNKRLNELDFTSYAVTLMPEYSLVLKNLVLRVGLSKEKVSMELSETCFANYIQNCNQLLLEDGINRLFAVDSKLNEERLTKELLLCYLCSHILFSYEAIEKYSDGLSSVTSEGDEIEKLKYNVELSLEHLLKTFQASLQDSDKQKVEMISLIFFHQMSNILTLNIRSDLKISEDTANIIGELISKYYSQAPIAAQNCFRSSLANLLLSKKPSILQKAFLKHDVILQKVIEDVWFDEKIFEKECSSYFSLSLNSSKNLIDYSSAISFNPSFQGSQDDQSSIVKKNLSTFLERIKISMKSIDCLSIEVIQGRLSILHLGIHKKRVEIQLDIFSRVLATNPVLLTQDQRRDLRDQLLKLREFEFGLVSSLERSIFDIINGVLDLSFTYNSLDNCLGILNSIRNMSEGCFKLFLNQSEMKDAKIEEIQEYGRLNAVAYGFFQEVTKPQKNQKTKKANPQKRSRKNKKEETHVPEDSFVRNLILTRTQFSALKAEKSLDPKIIVETLRKIIKFCSTLDTLKTVRESVSQIQNSIFSFLFLEHKALDELLEETIGKLQTANEEEVNVELKFLFAVLKFMTVTTDFYDESSPLDFVFQSRIFKKLPQALKMVENLSKPELNSDTNFTPQKFFRLCLKFYTKVKSKIFEAGIITIGPALANYSLPKKSKLESLKDFIQEGRTLFLNANFSQLNLFSENHLTKIAKNLINLLDWNEEFFFNLPEELEEKKLEAQKKPDANNNSPLISNSGAPALFSGGGIFQNADPQTANKNQSSQVFSQQEVRTGFLSSPNNQGGLFQDPIPNPLLNSSSDNNADQSLRPGTHSLQSSNLFSNVPQNVDCQTTNTNQSSQVLSQQEEVRTGLFSALTNQLPNLTQNPLFNPSSGNSADQSLRPETHSLQSSNLFSNVPQNVDRQTTNTNQSSQDLSQQEVRTGLFSSLTNQGGLLQNLNPNPSLNTSSSNNADQTGTQSLQSSNLFSNSPLNMVFQTTNTNQSSQVSSQEVRTDQSGLLPNLNQNPSFNPSSGNSADQSLRPETHSLQSSNLFSNVPQNVDRQTTNTNQSSQDLSQQEVRTGLFSSLTNQGGLLQNLNPNPSLNTSSSNNADQTGTQSLQSSNLFSNIPQNVDRQATNTNQSSQVLSQQEVRTRLSDLLTNQGGFFGNLNPNPSSNTNSDNNADQNLQLGTPSPQSSSLFSSQTNENAQKQSHDSPQSLFGNSLSIFNSNIRNNLQDKWLMNPLDNRQKEEKKEMSNEQINEKIFTNSFGLPRVLTIDELNSLRKDLRKSFISQSYKEIINQFMLIIVNYETCLSVLKVLQKLFEGVSSDKGFRQYLTELTQETKNILKTFSDENSNDKPKEVKLNNLPKVNCGQSLKFNTLLSGVMYLHFLNVVDDKIPESQRDFLPPEIQKDFLPRQGNKLLHILYNLADKKLQAAWNESVVIRVLSALSQKPTYLRYNLNVGLYNIPPSNDFKKEQQDVLDLIYDGAKFILSNTHIFSEDIIMMECQNLFSLMIWNRVYSEKIIQENLLANLISLQDESRAKIVPFMLDMLISEQIPIENRIEIALKGAFLREASLILMDRRNALGCLEPLLMINKESFSSKFHQILGVKQIKYSKTSNNQQKVSAKAERKEGKEDETQKKSNQQKEEEEKKKQKEDDKVIEDMTKKISSAEYAISFKTGISKLL